MLLRLLLRLLVNFIRYIKLDSYWFFLKKKKKTDFICLASALLLVMPSAATSTGFSAATPSGINICSVIQNAAVFLHGKCHLGENLKSSQLITMACGLSCILDINSDEAYGSQRLLFSKDIWGKVCVKYTKKRRLNIPMILTELHQQWNLISYL